MSSHSRGAWAAMLALTLTLAGHGMAPGNGGTLRLARVDAGPFLVSAWTQPQPPRVGPLDVSVAVMRPPHGEAILDAEATVSATPMDGASSALQVKAVRGAGGNLLLYHAAIELPHPGRWRVTVSVRSPAGRGTAAFDVTAEPGWPVQSVVVGVAVLGLVAWLVWRLRRRHGAAGRIPESRPPER